MVARSRFRRRSRRVQRTAGPRRVYWYLGGSISWSRSSLAALGCRNIGKLHGPPHPPKGLLSPVAAIAPQTFVRWDVRPGTASRRQAVMPTGASSWRWRSHPAS
eukprot:7790983-Pyramimonas_sp.AAC.1